jgi:rhodanese-related sulfurtransferase
MFIDAREPEEFECGTIPGSVNIPFEYLPEHDVEAYIDSALGGILKDHPVIIFCSGEECDVSLHLGRNMQQMGYENISIFFGGAREWQKFGLEIERRIPCDG